MENHSATEDYLVQKANVLIHASYSMTLTEQQLLMAGISRLNPEKGVEGCREPVELTVTEIQDLFYTATDRQNAYRDMEAAANRLFDREVLFGNPQTGKYERERWVSGVSFNAHAKAVTLRMNETLAPYFFDLRKNFTSYRMKYAARLTSTYAVRIYEFIASWYGQNRRFWEIPLEDLRMMLEITQKYKQFGELRKFVIETAVKQINESSDFELDVSYRKRGRSYTHIQFRFNRKDEAIAEDEARKAKKIMNQEGKDRRLQVAAKAATEEAQKNKVADIKSTMAAIPEGAVYVNPKGVTFTKSGDFFECSQGGVMTAKMAVEMIQSGKLRVLATDFE